MRKSTQEEFINLVIKFQGDKYSFEKTIFVNQRTCIIVTCKKHQFDFPVVPSVLLGNKKKRKKERSFKVGSCPKCKEEYSEKIKVPKIKKVFCSKAKNTLAKPNERIKRINGKKHYACEIHGNVLVGESRRLRDGCPTCNMLIRQNGRAVKKSNKVLNVNPQVNKINNNIVNYIPYQELKDRVNLLGITSHSEYRKWRKRTSQIDTPCNPDRVYKTEWISYYEFFNKNKIDLMSVGERKIYNYLKRKGYNFETQKKFIDCKNIHSLPFDFYLPEYNTLIEFDGQQHFKVSNFSTSAEVNKKKFEQLQKNDKIKTVYCENKNINLIRLDDKDLSNNIIEWSLDTELSRIAAEIAISEFKIFLKVTHF